MQRTVSLQRRSLDFSGTGGGYSRDGFGDTSPAAAGIHKRLCWNVIVIVCVPLYAAGARASELGSNLPLALTSTHLKKLFTNHPVLPVDAAGRASELGSGMPRASTPRSARPTDGYDSDSDDDDVNEVNVPYSLLSERSATWVAGGWHTSALAQQAVRGDCQCAACWPASAEPCSEHDDQILEMRW